MSDVSAHHPRLQHYFDSLEQQRASVTMGMWLFLVTEVMFFGGLFAMYAIYRFQYPEAFAAASHHLDVTLGAVNTAVLIGSSLTMAMAVWSAHKGAARLQVLFLCLTMALGATFLVIKGFEYQHKWHEHLVPGPHFQFDGPEPGHARMFFHLYFTMTGLHALHMIIGMGYMVSLIIRAARGAFTKEWNDPVEIFGLYWHFVDIIWIFLFPLLYLVGRHAT